MKLKHLTMSNILSIKILSLVILATAIFTSTQASAEEQPPSGGWEFSTSVYLWGLSIGGETADGEDIDIGFSDLWENLNFAVMTWVTARNGNWLVFGDVQYAHLEGDDSTTVNVGPGMELDADLDLELTQWVIQAGGGYTVSRSSKHILDVFAGFRYLYQDSELEFDIGATDIVKVDDSADNIDAIIGVNSMLYLNEKWYLNSYLDVGTGESNLTWQGMALLGYQFNTFSAVMGYRYTYWDFDGDKGLGKDYDELDFSGPIVGATFRF